MWRENIKYILLLSGLLLIACDPIDVPAPNGATPIFQLEAQLGNDSLKWSADNNFFMETGTFQDALGVQTFWGAYQPEGCDQQCRPSLRLEIRDYEQSTVGGAFDPAVSLAEGSYDFVEPVISVFDTTYQYRVFPDWLGTPGLDTFNYLFSLPDTIIIAPAPIVFEMENNSAFPVGIEALGDCQGTYVNQMIGPAIAPWQFDVEASIVQGGAFLQYTVNHDGGEPPFTYSWSTGETTASIIVPIQDSIPDQPIYFTHLLSITDNTGQNVEKSFTTEIMSTPVGGNQITSFCELGLNFETDLEITGGPINELQLSRVNWIYIDDNGQEYRSDRQVQPNDSFFEILSREAFEENNNGQLTQNITLRFRVHLFDSQGGELILESENSNFAVATPD
ncbi:MAG: hypothetical protein MRY78_17525 [Saprospiraceae bacterium]|nr:hypothetical protein [Saprospiraceae bacterium]